jgi:hypothetical protein
MSQDDQVEEVEEEKLSFDGLGPDEDVILVLQKHAMILLKPGLIISVGAILVVASFAVFGASLYSSLAALIYIILAGYYGLSCWHLWQRSKYIVTTNRVISINQGGLFHKVISEVPINIIKNVSYETKGIGQTLLDYGTVNILTSGKEEPDVVFPDIGHPYEVQQRITEMMLKLSHPTNQVRPTSENVLR